MDSLSSAMGRGIADMASTEARIGAEHLRAVQQTTGSQALPVGPQAAASATDSLLSFNNDNYEAVVRSGHVLATGVQEMHRDLAATAQSVFDDAREVMAAFASVRSIRDLMGVQASLVRSTMDKALTRSIRMTGSSMELTQQTLKPITARVTTVAKGFTPNG